MSNFRNEQSVAMTKASMWLGTAVMVALGAYLVIFAPMDGNMTLAVIMSLAIFSGTFFAFLGMERPGKDERAWRIGTTAVTYSWFITLWALGVTLIADVALGLGTNLARYFGIALVVMMVTMMGYNLYLGRKGDVG
jgi:uncharacterized membrane protein